MLSADNSAGCWMGIWIATLFFHFLLVFLYIPGRRNPYPLPTKQNRDNQQRKKTHDARERPKRDEKPLPLDPLGDEKRPSEWDSTPEDAYHHEAVACELVV